MLHSVILFVALLTRSQRFFNSMLADLAISYFQSIIIEHQIVDAFIPK
jgi:hypothetical protein